jgi:hypothetical protein
MSGSLQKVPGRGHQRRRSLRILVSLFLGSVRWDANEFLVFDPKIAPLRKVYTKIMLMTLTLTIIMMWICLPVYW